MELGQDEDAIQAFRRTIALESEEGSGALYAQIGIALFELGDTAGSSRAYALALAKDQDNLSARTNLGWNHYAKGKLDSAVHQFNTVLAKEPNSVAHFNLGLALLAKGDVERAVETYRQALVTYGAEEGRRIGATKDLERLIARGIQTRGAREILAAFGTDP